MAYKLSEINKRVLADPAEFTAECEAVFNGNVINTAEKIAAHSAVSPLVLLSGPSSAGKTTTANKICDALKKHGIRAHTISLDNYFFTFNPETAPKTKKGEYDFESPLCLDMALLNEHFRLLALGEEVNIPYFSFPDQARQESRATPMRLGTDAVAIFEGIHALNDAITAASPAAFKLYINARSNIDESGKTLFKSTWTRLVRRVVRDERFRGTRAQLTLDMWANVRRGEKKYISPFKNRADVIFDTSMPYEIPVMKNFANASLIEVPSGSERYEELRGILPALSRFEALDEKHVPEDSILREFIGGGKYAY